jgi:2-polyprenyl-3-methyl-5-hydroxy-6-metoxy-1,4-benzoquinol methylase
MGLLSGYLRNQRIARVGPHIRGRVLDVGCGGADILRQYHEKIDQYVGLEYNSKHVADLSGQFPNATFQVCNLDEESFNVSVEFDCIVLVAVIEHIFNLKHLLAEICEHMAPDGVVVLTTPTPFGNDIVHRCGAAMGLFSQGAADDHIAIFNAHRISILAREVGLKMISHRRFQFGCNQIAVLAHPDPETPRAIPQHSPAVDAE